MAVICIHYRVKVNGKQEKGQKDLLIIKFQKLDQTDSLITYR